MLYRTMIEEGIEVRADVQATAAQYGFTLPEPARTLERWEPEPPEMESLRLRPQAETVTQNALVIECDPHVDRADHVAICDALRRAERAGHCRRTMYRREPSRTGYAWYEALDRVTDMRIEASRE